MKLIDKLINKVADKFLAYVIQMRKEELICHIINTGVINEIQREMYKGIDEKLENRLDSNIKRLEYLNRELDASLVGYRIDQIVRESTQTHVYNYVSGEKFIDEIVERIKRKQL